MAPQRICFLAPYAYPFFDPAVDHVLGGAERQQVLMARALARRGYRVAFIVADFGQPARVMVDGIELVAAFPIASRLPRPLRLAQKYLGLLRAIDRLRRSLFYLRSNLALAVLLWVARALLGIRYVYNVASDSDLERTALDSRLVFAAFRRAARAADGLVAQTVRQQRLLRRRLGKSAPLVRSFLPAPPAADGVPPLSERREVLWVGRLEPIQKQPLLFVELARRMPKQPFLMIGQPMADRGLAEAVRRAAQELPNLQYRARVPPDEIGRCYRRALALVCTSTFEGFPGTFVEAWSAGTPVLSTVDPEGLIARHGAGRLFDSVETAAAHLRALREDEQAYAATSAACLRLIDRVFDEQESMDRLERLLCLSARC